MLKNGLNIKVELYFDIRKSLVITKSFDPCQPARTAQADMG